jgi:RNA 3'-terminal phosphate cyclase (ATP)
LEEEDANCIFQNSSGLVFQAILPYILFSGSGEDVIAVTIKGGTNVSNSPSIDYIQQVLLPMLVLVGLPEITAKVHHRGWSTGRNEMGAVTFKIPPIPVGSHLPAFRVTNRGDIIRIQAKILAPKISEKNCIGELNKAVEKAFPSVEFDVQFEDSFHPKRLYILLVATSANGQILGRDWLYDHKITSLESAVSKLVSRVVNDLSTELKHGGCVDEFMRDQLTIFQALANGKSEVEGGTFGEKGDLVEASLHAQTAQWVATELLGVKFNDEGSCEGVGFVAGGEFERKEKVGESKVDEMEEQIKNLEMK